MATSSITKEFYVRDQVVFERLKKELNETTVPHKVVMESSSLKKSKEKLATFVCR